jgi:two-component system chemotaxis response regulator CheB
LFAALPADYPAAVFVVLHLAPDSPSILPEILNRDSPMPVTVARTGARIRPGTAMIAPPDLHLVLEPERVVLLRGPRENRHRPSVDVLFRSAAVTFGRRVTGVILSGMQDDGAAGLWAIKRRGGAAVVQQPDDAEYPDMPGNALAVVRVDASVPMREMPAVLLRIARESGGEAPAPAPSNMEKEVRIVAANGTTPDELDTLGQRVALTCPECGGSLWEIDNGGPRYRCYNGHAYSLQTLADEQTIQVEAALWAGLRKLEESERLAHRMAAHARQRGNERSASYHAEMAHSTAQHAATLRQLLSEKGPAAPDPAANE